MIRVLLFTLGLFAALAPLMAQPQKKTESLKYYCYWMENASGRFEWVPAEVGGMYRGEGYEQCFALDSCDGGQGQSAGGCYKWARAANSPGVKWVKKAQ